MYEKVLLIVSDYTFHQIVIGTTLLGAVSGAVGVFALLRKQSLLGDAVSHAAFPGILIAFLCTLSKNPLILLVGGVATGLIGAACVTAITYYSVLKHDTALGIVLSVFFGGGLVLLTHIQKLQLPNQSILNKFLFGNAATLLPEDSFLIGVVSAFCLTILFLFKKQFSLIAFDEQYARVLGYTVLYWDLLLAILLVLTIVVGLQTVGVVLMSSLLIAPAAAARQWTNTVFTMIMLSALFGAIASSVGALISCVFYQLPTGPVIVIVMSVWVLFSIVCGSAHGLLWHRSQRKTI